MSEIEIFKNSILFNKLKELKEKEFPLETPEQFNLGEFLTWAFTKRLNYKRLNNG